MHKAKTCCTLTNPNSHFLARCRGTNSMVDVIFDAWLGAVIRSVVALHNLINNKLALKDAENEGDKVC